VVTSLIERSEKHDLADRVLVITGRPGRIKEDITVQLEGPRSYERLISSTSAAALKGHVFHLVREEAMKTMEATPPQ
jgi:ABC-type nitrate/sulfonate/bicarbonate transport system ATPase subunit